jgi:hypothetical protein
MSRREDPLAGVSLGHDPDGVGLVGGGLIGQSQGCGWVERGAAQVLELADGSHGESAPAPESQLSTAQTTLRQLVSPGSRPMTFTRRRSHRMCSMKLECRTRV